MELRRLRTASISLLIAGLVTSCQNPLGDSSDVVWNGTQQIDSTTTSTTTTTTTTTTTLPAMTATFDFQNATDYEIETGVQVSGGQASLASRDVKDDSSVTGGSDLNFADRASVDANLTVASNQVTMTSGTTGTFVSRIMDYLAPTAEWSGLRFISSLPFGKEVAPTAETGYGATVSNLSNGLVGLWHLNEAAGTVAASSISDASASANHGSPVGGVVFGGAAKLATGASLDGTDDRIQVSATGFPTGANARTTAIWFRKDVGSGNRVMFAYGDSAGSALWEMMVYNGHLILHAHGGGFDTIGIPAPVTENEWTHAAIKYVGGQVTVYLNGVNRGSTAMALNTGNTFFNIGGPGYFAIWKGQLDEAAVWNRGLTDTEVEQLYRRGANRLKVQVRSCPDSTCSTNPTWIGPDATSSTYFTELNNNTQPYLYSGNVVATPFAVPWADFAGLNAPFSAWVGANKVHRYAQYKTVFESDSATFFPDLTQVHFTPNDAYLTTKPSVKSKVSIAADFVELHGIAITDSGTCANVHYDIGNDANQFYSWSAGAWVASTSYSDANTKAALLSLTQAQWQTFPRGTGKLFVRAFLYSDGATNCQVDEISFHGLKN